MRLAVDYFPKRLVSAQRIPLATKFPPTEVEVLKFRTADMCAKYGKKHRNEGFVHIF